MTGDPNYSPGPAPQPGNSRMTITAIAEGVAALMKAGNPDVPVDQALAVRIAGDIRPALEQALAGRLRPGTASAHAGRAAPRENRDKS